MIVVIGFATLPWSFTWSDMKNYHYLHTYTHTHCQPLPSLTSDHLNRSCTQSEPQNKAYPLEQDFLVGLECLSLGSNSGQEKTVQ